MSKNYERNLSLLLELRKVLVGGYPGNRKMKVMPALREGISRGFDFLDSRRIGFSEQRGQELLEFAIILPLLMLVVFGILDLGRGLHAAIAITNVAREGARFGINFNWEDPNLPNPIQSGYDAIEIVALGEAEDTALDLNKMNVSSDCGDCDEDLPLTVIVTYDFDLLLGVLPGFTITRFNTMMIP